MLILSNDFSYRKILLILKGCDGVLCYLRANILKQKNYEKDFSAIGARPVSDGIL